MKKIWIAVLALALAVSFAACGSPQTASSAAQSTAAADMTAEQRVAALQKSMSGEEWQQMKEEFSLYGEYVSLLNDKVMNDEYLALIDRYNAGESMTKDETKTLSAIYLDCHAYLSAYTFTFDELTQTHQKILDSYQAKANMFILIYDNYAMLSGDEQGNQEEFESLSAQTDTLMLIQNQKLSEWAEDISAYSAAFGIS